MDTTKKVFDEYKEKVNKFNSVNEVLMMSGIDNWNLAKVSEDSISFSRKGLFINVEEKRDHFEVSLTNEGDVRKRFSKEDDFLEALQDAYEVLSKLDDKKNFRKIANRLG